MNVRLMTMTALCMAILAVLAQVTIPMPSGVPITLQTLAVALVGCVLGLRASLMCVGGYLLLGAVGLPVFAGFGSGVAKLVGVTGGFLWGFLPMAALCALGAGAKNRWAGLGLCLVGLVTCHALGIAQFALVSGNSPAQAAMIASVPYLIKDILSVAAAWYLSALIRRAVPFLRV